MKEVAPNIFCIPQRIGFKQYKLPVNVYVLAGRDGIVFDSGLAWKKKRHYLAGKIKEISAQMADRGMPCSITRAMASHGHWDHFAALAFFEEHLGLKILATREQSAKIGSKKGYLDSFKSQRARFGRPVLTGAAGVIQKTRSRLLHELQIFLLKINFISKPVIIKHEDHLQVDDEIWQVIHLPGHCDDDIVLYNKERGILLAGDLLLRSITTWLGPPKSDLERYIQSLETLLELPGLKLILPAHGSPISAPQKRIREAIGHRKARTREVFDMLSNSGNNGMTFEAILQGFYPGIKFYQRSTLGGWIAVTLQFLVDKKAAIPDKRGHQIFFKPGNLIPEKII